MFCSQEDKPGTSRSSRDIAKELNIDARSVRRIAKKELHLSAFKRVPVQVISNDKLKIIYTFHVITIG